MSPAGVHNLQRLPFHEAYPPNPTLAQNVYNWQLGLTWTGAVPQEGHRPSRSPTPVPSISDLSDASTVRDYAEDDTCGTWLSSNPLEFRTDVV